MKSTCSASRTGLTHLVALRVDRFTASCMRRTASLILALMLWVMWAHTCGAQTFVPESNRTFYFDLDIKDGDYSSWSLGDLGQATALRATLEIRRIGKARDWVPYFLVTVQTADSRYGVVFEAPDGEAPIVLSTFYRGSKTDDVLHSVAVGEVVSVETDWATPGTLVIGIANAKTVQLAVPGSIRSIFVSASTGRLTMHSLELGRFVK